MDEIWSFDNIFGWLFNLSAVDRKTLLLSEMLRLYWRIIEKKLIFFLILILQQNIWKVRELSVVDAIYRTV